MKRAAVALLLAPLLAAPALARAWDDLARAEARSALIVRGVLRGDAAAIRRAAGGSGYVTVAVRVREVLKGDAGEEVRFRLFASGAKADPVLRGLGEERIVLLVSSGGALYLADAEGRAAVFVPGGERAEEIARRIADHRGLREEPLAVDEKRAAAVGVLIEKLKSSPEGQREALAALEAMGDAAVPAIAAAMDDRAKLPARAVTFANRGEGAFEAVRHYSPELVVDALAALLNQVTGESFGIRYNQATDAERAHEVLGWRVYARYLLAPPPRGEPVGGVAVSLEAAQERFGADEPLRFTVSLLNVGEEPLRLENLPHQWFYRIRFESLSDGSDFDGGAGLFVDLARPYRDRLAPGAAFSRTVDPSRGARRYLRRIPDRKPGDDWDYRETLRPGRYRATVAYERRRAKGASPDGVWTGRAVSNAVEIEVAGR